MKFTLLLILLVAVMAKPQTNGSILGTLGKIAKYICDKISKKRDASEFDKNLDGFIDESELYDVFTTRETRQVLEMADQDRNSQVAMDEFQQLFTELRKRE